MTGELQREEGWHTGEPDTCGWYLICCRTNDQSVDYYVLMAWFNPDAIHKWWKGVEANRCERTNLPVHYWMPCPAAPTTEPAADPPQTG